MLKKFAIGFTIFIALAVGLFYLDEWWFDRKAPETFSKPNADARARKHLIEYSKEHNVSFYEFKGPYFKEHLGLDFPVYTVCYRNPNHYFCYDDWHARLSARTLEKGEEQPRDYSSPDYEGW